MYALGGGIYKVAVERRFYGVGAPNVTQITDDVLRSLTQITDSQAFRI